MMCADRLNLLKPNGTFVPFKGIKEFDGFTGQMAYRF